MQPYRPPNWLSSGTPIMLATQRSHRYPTDILSVKSALAYHTRTYSQMLFDNTLTTHPPSPFISTYTTRQYIGALHNMFIIIKKYRQGIQEPRKGVITSLTCLSDTLRASMITCPPLTANHCQVIKAR